APRGVSDGTRHIPLRGKRGEGLFVTVSAEDYDLARAYHWYLAVTPQGRRYAYGRRAGAGGDKVYLHRLIMDAPAGMDVDHVRTEDTLDCTRPNLRLATRSQNNLNTRSRGG